MKAIFETIYPEYAARLLTNPKNVNFRPLCENTARNYAESMKAGKWDVNGESIKIHSS